MKRIIFIILGSINICLAYAQSFNGQYISEWQWDMNKNTNLINQLRLELSVPIGRGKDSFEAATLHVAKTNDYHYKSDLPRNFLVFHRCHLNVPDSSQLFLHLLL